MRSLSSRFEGSMVVCSSRTDGTLQFYQAVPRKLFRGEAPWHLSAVRLSYSDSIYVSQQGANFSGHCRRLGRSHDVASPLHSPEVNYTESLCEDAVATSAGWWRESPDRRCSVENVHQQQGDVAVDRRSKYRLLARPGCLAETSPLIDGLILRANSRRHCSV